MYTAATRLDNFEQQLMSMEPLITNVMLNHRVPGLESEDYRQELRIKVWDAWRNYDPDCGTKFSTFAYQYLINATISLYRMAVSQKRAMDKMVIVNLEDCDNNSNEDGPSIPYSSRSTSFDSIYAREKVPEIIREIVETEDNPAAKKVYEMYLGGIPKKDISERSGYGIGRVNYYIDHKLKKRLQKAIDNEGIDITL